MSYFMRDDNYQICYLRLIILHQWFAHIIYKSFDNIEVLDYDAIILYPFKNVAVIFINLSFGEWKQLLVFHLFIMFSFYVFHSFIYFLFLVLSVMDQLHQLCEIYLFSTKMSQTALTRRLCNYRFWLFWYVLLGRDPLASHWMYFIQRFIVLEKQG